MMFSKAVLALGLGAFLSAASPMLANAAVPMGQPLAAAQPLAGIIPAADGCGYGYYRGPYGACHPFGAGPYPGGYYYAPRPYYGPYRQVYNASGCPIGFWRGPWGDCRNTPYHGPLPGGGWQY